MEKQFNANNFFNLEDISFADIFTDCEFVWDVQKKLTSYIKEQFDSGKIKANYKNIKYVHVGEGTSINDLAQIQGPAIIGRNCIIYHAALLRGPCLLGDNVHIGHASEIKDSILLNGAISAHLNYVGNSIVGNNVNISGGSIVANVRLDKKPVFIKNGEDKIETNLTKLGAIIGDDSVIGVNAVLNPGTVLGKHSVVYPLTVVKGVHSQSSIIK